MGWTGSRRAAALASVVVLGLGACSGDDEPSAEPIADADPTTTTTVAGPEELTDGDFYAVPDPLPDGEHGDLLRFQEIDDDVDGSTAYRLLYLSESVQGDPIAVTGTALVPEGAAPDGGWPVIAHSHGTTGLADECAPSRNYPDRVGELTLLATVADRFVIAATDYEGLGTPGLHPYLVGESEGRGTLDAALAAAQLPGVEASPTTFIAGYSQGGHGALWANQLAASWTPELDVRGAFAGAPPGELPVIAAVAGQGGVAGGFFMLIAAGHAAAYPDAHLEDILTPEGVEAVAIADEACVGEALGALSGGGYVLPDPTSVDPWGEVLAASNPGDVRAPSPVLIVHSQADEVVPIGLSAAILNRQCAVRQVVERRVLPSGTHGGAAPGAYQQAFEWFDGLLDGQEPVSSCPS
jgi:hypothetical protein